MDLKEQAVLGDAAGAHWYYRAKAAAVRKAVSVFRPRNVLDVGGGSGFFSKTLLRDSTTRSALCVDPGYTQPRDEPFGDKVIRFRRECESVDADLVLMMDILEHVDDDCGLLREYVQKTPPHATFLITVPAFSFLWSEHDVYLEHRRRYTLPQLEDVVHSVGLRMIRGWYYFASVLPLAAAIRLGQRVVRRPAAPRSHLRQHAWLTNQVLYAMCMAELPLMFRNRMAGLSVFCLANRPRAAYAM